MDEIEPPPGAVLVRAAGFREGQSFYYKFPGMSDEEIRTYYKKELAKMKWTYMEYKNKNGDCIFHNGKIVLRLQKSRVTKEKVEYDWIITLFNDE